MSKTITTTISIPADLLEWFDTTFPGLNRSWFYTHALRRMQNRFNEQHYPILIEEAVDSIYDDLQNGDK
jgi:hypothetical protein